MTSITYASWPFRPALARSIDEEANWWSHCYLENEISRIVVGWPHWRVIVGGPGSGKSVLLTAVARTEEQAGRSLAVYYPPMRWPGAQQAFVPEGNHLAQIMAAVALSLRDHLSRSPAQIPDLTPGQHTALRWMLDRYLGSRAFTRWVDGLPHDAMQLLQKVAYTELYSSTTTPAEALGQVDEAVNLAYRLGFDRLLLIIDLNDREALANLSSMSELFSWLALMHQPGLALLAAIPDKAANSIDLVSRIRGRVNVAQLVWEESQVYTLAEQHLRAALANPTAVLTQYADTSLFDILVGRLQAEFSGIAPLGWIWLVETILYYASQRRDSLPLSQSHSENIWRNLHVRHLPLDLVKGRGIWRGPRFIPLDPQPLSLVELLWQKTMTPLNVDDPDVQLILAGAKDKKGLLHTLARRIRRAIEPEPSHPIYLKNDRGEGGYWLENIVTASPLTAL